MQFYIPLTMGFPSYALRFCCPLILVSTGHSVQIIDFNFCGDEIPDGKILVNFVSR